MEHTAARKSTKSLARTVLRALMQCGNGVPEGPASKGQTKLFLLAEKQIPVGSDQPLLPPEGFLPCRGLRVMFNRPERKLHLSIGISQDDKLEAPSRFTFACQEPVDGVGRRDLLAPSHTPQDGTNTSQWFLCCTRVQGMPAFTPAL
mmetsp:Transcript_15656/g.39807  ORF Transcript_15656/g.39807 Transcript_15656/m.39807 type:complete len:147 (-) Transcript_15656:62-502(-)